MSKLSSEQYEAWRPYIELVGEDGFHYDAGGDGMMPIVQSKFYCGPEPIALGMPSAFLAQAFNRAKEYQQLTSKDLLTLGDIERITTSLVQEQYYDDELFHLLVERQNNMTLDEHWNLIIDCWMHQEFTTEGQRRENWLKIFKSRKPLESLVSDLPDSFVAYRAGELDGFSWTLDKDVAEWFKQRFENQFGDVEMHQRTFKKSDALFYTNRRKEKEVVIIPK